MRRGIAAVFIAVSVAACGGGTKTVTVIQSASPQQQPASKVAAQSPVSQVTKTQVSLPCPPPPGEGVMGACTPKPVQVFGTKVTPVTVDPPASIPDVSSYQRVVNWPAIRRWQLSHHFAPAGIFKMGEYVLDPYASTNNAALTRLHMWRAGYWFVRNTGCAYEGTQIKNEARTLRLKIVELDVEVPEARNYDGCLTAILKRAGLIVGEYGSPGAYPGGSHTGDPAWVAAYGPANPPFAPWGGKVVAFQCTDGVFGCVTYVPGLGRSDMSEDLGITRLGLVKPDPYGFLDKTVRHFGRDHASEYNTVKTWDRSKCRNPVRRPVCQSSRFHLTLLRDRLNTVTHGRGTRSQRVRIAALNRRLSQR